MASGAWESAARVNFVHSSNSSWRALTAYDSSSVMHCPQCNGTNSGDLVLTALDRTGAGSLYP
jgi:serralysin